jgi:hypothetical protein
MTHTDQQWVTHDIDLKQDFKAWELMAIALVLVCANWVLTLLLLSIPPAQAKQIERPLHGAEQQVAKAG